MKNWIAKSMLGKDPVEIIFSVGGAGKSMSLSSINMLEKVDKKSTLVVYSNGTLSNALVTKGGERGVFSALLSSFGSNPLPERLCLEVTKPGQISEQLLSQIERVTLVISSLLEEDTESKDRVKKYLEKLIPMLKKSADKFQVVANADHPILMEALEEYDFKKLVTFGVDNPDADIRATNIEFLLAEAQSIDQRLRGLTCKVQHFGSNIPLQVTGGIGKPHVYAKLSALGVAHLLGVSAVELLGFLRQERILPGRMSLIPGIKKSLLIDDSYDMTFENAQLAISQAATIAKDDTQKRIAVLGSMSAASSTRL